MFLLWVAVTAIALSSSTAESDLVESSLYVGPIEKPWFTSAERYVINSGQCTGYVKTPPCNHGFFPLAVRVTVKDTNYSQINMDPQFASVSIYRRTFGGRGGRAGAMVRLLCSWRPRVRD